MSIPSGTDPDDTAGENRGSAAEVEGDPITEIIEAARAPLTDTAERRYTAPGFDAGSTQIIDLPDEDSTPTKILFTTARRRIATPTSIPARISAHPSWRIPIMVAVAALAATTILGLLLFHRVTSMKTARVNAVRSTIETFDTAVRTGDLARLRTITCGETKQSYDAYDEKAWAEAYARIAKAKQYPVIADIDDVVVDGDHAEANVTTYMAFDPGTRSTRSFDLQYRDDGWKVCQAT